VLNADYAEHCPSILIVMPLHMPFSWLVVIGRDQKQCLVCNRLLFCRISYCALAQWLRSKG